MTVRRLVLLSLALLVVTCSLRGTAATDDTELESSIREKRQADFSDPADNLRRECLRKSRRACCPLLNKKKATEFVTCVHEHAWSNDDIEVKPGCPGYPRCNIGTRG